MADFHPIKANFNGGNVESLGEFQATDTVGIADGGTGATTAVGARTNLGLTAQGIANLINADTTAEATLKSALNLGTAAYTASTTYATAAQGLLAASALQPGDVDDTPVNGVTTAPVSSNWAYDHVAAADPHPGYRLESAAIDLTNSVTGALPIANGGTGSTTAATARTALGIGSIATQAATNVNIDGGAIDGTTIGVTTKEDGYFDYLQAVSLNVDNNGFDDAAVCNLDSGANGSPTLSLKRAGAPLWLISTEASSNEGFIIRNVQTSTSTIVIDDVTDKVTLSDDLEVGGYAKLGPSAPGIRMAKITGTMPSPGGQGNYSTGVDDARVIGMMCKAYSDDGVYGVAPGHPLADWRYAIFVSGTNFHVYVASGEGANITGSSNQFEAVILYEVS